MNNINQNQTLKYTGSVVIKAAREGKEQIVCKTHNEGGVPLISFLSYCLAGEYEKSLLPIYITCSDENDTRLIPLYPYSRVYINPDKTVQYTFTVPAASFGSGTFKVKKLYLYCDKYKTSSNTLSDWSAQVTLDSVETFNTTAQDALIVEWTLSLSSTD